MLNESQQALEVRIGNQLVRPDRVRTAEAYRQIDEPWANLCSCTPCRNFAPQRASAFPKGFVLLLTKLGIDPAKEREVFGCYPLSSGKRQYGGWFFFCGVLVTDASGEVDAEDIAYHVLEPGNMPNPGELFEPHPLAIEFTIELAWILSSEDPDELYGPPAKNSNIGVAK